MKLAFHDLHTQYQSYQSEINAAIQDVLNTSQFIMGPKVKQFEEALAAFLSRQHAISCGSGTDALFLALLAIDLKPGDEVITSPFSFISAAEIICLLGGKPIFVDIEPDTYNIDAEKIEVKITAKTRAILPTALFGQPADMQKINALAKKYSEQFCKKIYVIEDAAQSLGATYQNKPSGALSDIGCLSFFPTKPLGCYGDGGALTVDDDLLAEKIKSLRIHGQTKRYHHKYLGFNCRLDTLQAAILTVKLRHFQNEIEMREKVAHYYYDKLAHLDLVLPEIKTDRTSVFAQFSIRVKSRASVIEVLNKNGIPTAIHYPIPLHLQECLAYIGHKQGDFPVAEMVAGEILSLPMGPFLTETQIDFISMTLQEFYLPSFVEVI